MSIFKKGGSALPDQPLTMPRSATEPKEPKAARTLWSGEISYASGAASVREIARIVLSATGVVTFEYCERDSMGEAKWLQFPESVVDRDSIDAWSPYNRPSYMLNPAIRACIAAAARDLGAL
jgi:hypothetical protein